MFNKYKEVMQKSIESGSIGSILKDSINNNELYLEFQPQVNVHNKKSLFGVEALARWKNNVLGQVSPITFISIAEENGFIRELGRYVLEESIKSAKRWYDQGYSFGHVAVNVSILELSNPLYVNNLIDLCAKYELPHSYIEIEITESVDFNSVCNAVEIINEIADAGFKIAIDDFGSGYSNLGSLIDLEVSTIKIDRSIINLLGRDKTQSIIKGVVGFGDGIGSHVLAEGVESEDQVNVLKELGCHLIQGYHYSKPLSVSGMDMYLKENY